MGLIVAERSVVRRFRALVVVLACLAAGPALAEPSSHPDAVAPVERLHAGLLATMKSAGKAAFSEREAALAPVVAGAFNLPLMTRFVAGAHWAKLSADQQAALIKAFGKSTVATYVGRFDGFSGERFETLGARDGRRGSVIVETRIVDSHGKPTALDYVVRHYDDGWRIVDIQLDGAYSELATKRAQYTSVLDREGVSGLIRQLDDLAAKFASKG